MNDRLIAYLGLCAVAAVLVGSLAILILQGSHNPGRVAPALQPAQIESRTSLKNAPNSAHAQASPGSVAANLPSLGL